MNNPLVSIIIPVWNVERYILKCIKSVISQTYDNLEIIIIDDSSPDNSISIIKNFLISNSSDRIIRFITHEQNTGLGGARRTGILQAKGEYVLSIDSDDWIESDYVEMVVKKAQEENSDIVISDYYVESKSKSFKFIQSFEGTGKDLVGKLMSGKLQAFVWNKLIRRSLYYDNNIFPIIGIDMWEDMDIICKLASKTDRISYINKPFVHYNLQNFNSYSTHNLSSKAINSIISTVNDLEQYFYNSPEFKNELINLKARAKAYILSEAKKEVKSSYKGLFPETKGIWRKKKLSPILDNIILFLSDINLPYMISTLIIFKEKAKNIIRR